MLKDYRPPDPSIWQGRDDGPHALRLHQVIRLVDASQGLQLKNNAIVLLGFACDTGVRRNLGKPGAVQGPEAWRRALANLPEIDERSIIDCGDIVCPDDDLEDAQEQLGSLIADILDQSCFPILCGGGHEIAWGHFLGISKTGREQSLGILNIDAHYDLRPLLAGGKGSSGTSFTQIAMHQERHHHPFRYACVGLQPLSNTRALHTEAQKHQVLTVLAEDIYRSLDKVGEFIRRSDHLLLTLCLDVFAEAYAPGVSAPQPLGISPREVLPILKMAMQSGKLAGCSIAELSPPNDLHGMTARLAAYLTMELCGKQMRLNGNTP